MLPVDVIVDSRLGTSIHVLELEAHSDSAVLPYDPAGSLDVVRGTWKA